MKLKTYRSKTMAGALAAVKKDLGAQAVILHTRKHKAGGWLGIGAREIVEVTASDGPTLARLRGDRKPRPQAQASPPAAAASKAYRRTEDQLLDLLEKSRAAPTEPPAAHIPPQPAPEPAQAAILPPAPAPAKPEPTPAQRSDGEHVPAVRMSVRRTGAPDHAPAPASLEDEIASIKRMVGRVLRQTHAGSVTPDSEGKPTDALTTHYLKLLEGEVAAEIVDEIVGRVRDELSSAELADPGVVRQTILRRVADLIPTSEDAPNLTGKDGSPLRIALVGPTGVGKTTTVAKLAATFKLRHGRRVGLITTDTYRIAAVDQLRTYAGIIGVPLRVVASPEEAEGALESLASCDVILIDTAGRSPRDADRLSESAAMLERMRPDQTHLVLAGTSSEQTIMAAAREFARLGPNRVIFTKLDEAVNFGVLLSVASRIDLAMSYVTTGQEVPDHIEPGRPDRIARLVLDGSVSV